MSEIKTAEQRIHKLEGGEGDSFVTVEQALIAERDELRKALADRDARLAALEKQEPVAYRFPKAGVDNGYNYCDSLDGEEPRFLKLWEKLFAAAGAASEWNDFVEIACARIKSADDAAADGDYMLDSSDCIKVLRGTLGGNYLNDHPVLPAAGAAPVPTDTERAALIEKLRKTDWTISASDLADLCAEAATMLAAAPKEPT